MGISPGFFCSMVDQSLHKEFYFEILESCQIGTTQAQRKLFFRIGDIGEHLDEASRNARIDDLAKELKVKPDDVIEVEARIKAREWSLNEVVGDDKDVTAMDLLPDHAPGSEDLLIERRVPRTLTATIGP